MKSALIVTAAIAIVAGLPLSGLMGGEIMSQAGKENRLGRFILHDDFINYLIWSPAAEPFNQAGLEAGARRTAASGADIISLCANFGEQVNFHPSVHGETRGREDYPTDNRELTWQRRLVLDGVDPYGVVLAEMRRQGIPVLAKFRVNDRHHIAGHPWLESRFWRENPQWHIGHAERNADSPASFERHPSIGPRALAVIREDRPRLLDYAVAEVRAKRLAVFREAIERYDVAGATLNFLREPYCISFPEKNAAHLTEFVRECRHIVDEVLGARGIDAPILGALLPWDIDFCRAMGMELDVWIAGGLLDYVSPSEGWVTEFNADILPWIELAKGTRCAVYPGIVGLVAHGAAFCLPDQYETQGRRANSAKIMPEQVRALAHRFQADGADGLSSFNLYAAPYTHLFPLSALVAPDRLDAGERSYLYLRSPRYYAEFNFLQMRLPASGNESRSFRFRVRERLNGAQAFLRFKARELHDVADLSVSLNRRELHAQRLTILPHRGSGFLYLHYSLAPDDLQDGDNEIAFSLNRPTRTEVVVQEIELRVQPHVSK